MNSCRESTELPLQLLASGEDLVQRDVWEARRKLRAMAGPTTEDWIAFLRRREQEAAQGIPLSIPAKPV